MRESDKSKSAKAMLEIRLCDVAELMLGKKKSVAHTFPPYAGSTRSKMMLLHCSFFSFSVSA